MTDRFRNLVPRVAAAIAYADIGRHGWESPADLWGVIDDRSRREYRAMARAAISECAREISATIERKLK